MLVTTANIVQASRLLWRSLNKDKTATGNANVGFRRQATTSAANLKGLIQPFRSASAKTENRRRPITISEGFPNPRHCSILGKWIPSKAVATRSNRGVALSADDAKQSQHTAET
jgi:hypothetical protein